MSHRRAALAIAALAMLVVTFSAIAAADASESRSTVEVGPDLAVSAGDLTVSKSVLLSGVEFNVSVEVYNLGDEDAVGVTVDFLLDSELSGRVTLDTVVKDTSETASLKLSSPEGDHELTVFVDADDVIDEKREDNNDATIQIHVRGLPDVMIQSDGILVSDTHPMEGDVVTLTARLHNQGESSATLVVVQFWDGIPNEGSLISNKTSSVAAGSEQLVSVQWDTDGLGGTHELYVLVTKVLPGEDRMDNNMASTTVLVFTIWDMVIDSGTGDVLIDQQWTQDGFVTVRDGRTLTIAGVVFEFLQDYDNQFALFVEGGASLVLESAAVQSDMELLVVMADGTSVHLRDGAGLQATVLLGGDVEVTMVDSVMMGGLSGNATSVEIVGSQMDGSIQLSSGSLDVRDSQFNIDAPAMLSGTSGVFVDSSLRGPSADSFDLAEGTRLELRNVTCNGIVADASSRAMVFRRVTVHVVDEATLVVPGADIEIRHFINGTVVGSATGGEDGSAECEVVSDVVEGSGSHFIGNYLVWARFSSQEALAPMTLTPFPSMEPGSNMPEVVVVLPPVEPRELVSSTSNDLTVEASDTLSLVADFVQDGNIVVKGTLMVSSSTLSVLQDRDHQFYVVVEGDGRLALSGGTMRSDYPINVYLYDNSTLELSPGSFLDVNAVVAKDGATFKAHGASIVSLLLLRGGPVSITKGCDVASDRVVIETSTFSLEGGFLTAETFTVSSPALSIEDVVVNSVNLSLQADFANVSNSDMSLGRFHVTATILTVQGSKVYSDEPLDLYVATFYMDTSISDQPIGESMGSSSKVYLYDVDIPPPYSLGNATVYIYWYLTTYAKDSLGNPVTGATVTAVYTHNETPAAEGVTNDEGKVRFPLLGSVVGPEGEQFVGNYKVTVQSPSGNGDDLVRYVNLDKGKTIITSFNRPMIPPNSIGVEINVASTSLQAGEHFNLTGSATAVFPTVRSPLGSGSVHVQLWNNASTWNNTTALSADGKFIVSMTAPTTTGVYYIKAVVTPEGEYEGVPDGVSSVISLTVEPPAPRFLVVVLDKTRIDDFPTGDVVKVSGRVCYNTALGERAANAKVFCKDPVSGQNFQQTADGLGLFLIQIPGPNYRGVYDYLVWSKDDALGIETKAQVKLTIVAVEVEEATEEEGTNWLLISVVVIVVVVGTIGGILGYWSLSNRGRMVECGECGTLVPENTKTCPKCGIEFEVEVAKCSVCESWIKADATVCPFCNTPFQDISDGDEAEEGEGDEGPPGTEGGGDVVVEEADGEVTGEVDVKKVPDGLKKETQPKPVVAKKAVREVVKEVDTKAMADNGKPVAPKPRVKKVAGHVASPAGDVPEKPSDATEEPSDGSSKETKGRSNGTDDLDFGDNLEDGEVKED